jgi:Ca-activated chloride channel homolog
MRHVKEIFICALLFHFLVLGSALPGRGETRDGTGQTPQRKRTVGQGAATDRQESQQQDEPQELSEGETLKIGVELVQVVFSVADEQNRLVTSIQQSDVEVYEGGQPQQIDLFRRSNSLPMVLSILIDMSGSQEFLLPNEKTSVDTFLDSFFRSGRDYGSILTFQGETSLAIGLTSNLKRLKTALGRIKREQAFRDEEGGPANLGTALYDAIDITSREILDGRTARRITGQDSGSGQNSLAAIRRAMIVLTDGVDTASQLQMKQALRRAQRLGIAIYAIGVSDRFRFTEVNRDILDQLCSETGGRAYYPKSESDLRRAFDQIATELSSQYILAYYPRRGASDANFREIEIRLPRRPGLQVIHRRGYVPDEKRGDD